MRFLIGTKRFEDSRKPLTEKLLRRGFRRGTWVAVAIGGSAIIGAGSQEGWFGGGGGKEKRPTYNLPDFKEDPYYGKSQEALYPMGKDLLAGKPSEYYAPIGEIGGQLFEDVLGMGRRDITKSITEDFARRNIRGARGSDVIGKAVGDYSKKARFDDYVRALQGRQFMLSVGGDITAGVGGRALTSQGQKATYEVSKGNLALGYAGLASREEQARTTAIGEGIGGGLKGIANLYEMSQLGKVAPNTSSVYNTGGGFRDISMMQNVPSGDLYSYLYR